MTEDVAGQYFVYILYKHGVHCIFLMDFIHPQNLCVFSAFQYISFTFANFQRKLNQIVFGGLVRCLN